VRSPDQSRRLQSLHDRGYFNRDEDDTADIARLHQRRQTNRITAPGEQW
jgi:hypothetical protein